MNYLPREFIKLGLRPCSLGSPGGGGHGAVSLSNQTLTIPTMASLNRAFSMSMAEVVDALNTCMYDLKGKSL